MAASILLPSATRTTGRVVAVSREQHGKRRFRFLPLWARTNGAILLESRMSEVGLSFESNLPDPTPTRAHMISTIG